MYRRQPDAPGGGQVSTAAVIREIRRDARVNTTITDEVAARNAEASPDVVHRRVNPVHR